MTTSIGEELLNLCRQAKSELVLAAPFMKETVIRKIISHVGSEVSIVCITRWRPEEINAGVSDIGVWKALNERSASKLLLLHNLHAKYYRADNGYLIGSANLTNRALGWSTESNIELLELGNDIGSLLAWESKLYSLCVEVDEYVVRAMETLVDNLPRINTFIADDYCEENSIIQLQRSTLDILPSIWLPSLRYPNQLYKAYIGRLEELSTSAKTAALADLSLLNLSQGLSEPEFNAAVAMLLLQMPLVSQVDRFLSQPRRFGEVRDLLRSSPGLLKIDSSRAWQTLMRWLLYFFPERYKLAVPHYSEIVFRVDNGNL